MAAPPTPEDEELLRAANEILANTTDYIPLTPIRDTAIARWIEIDEEQPVAIPLRRKDIDRLYFTLQALSASNVNFQNAVQSWTQGKPELANIYYEIARRENTRVYDSLARFMEAIMELGVKYDPEA